MRDLSEIFNQGLLTPEPMNRNNLTMIAGVVCIVVWTAALLGIFFAIMNALGLLRVATDEELAGLDVSKHGGTAYETTIAHKDELKADKPTGF